MIEPITLKMINAGMVATAHLTIRTTMDPNGILMSVTTTLLYSSDMLISSNYLILLVDLIPKLPRAPERHNLSGLEHHIFCEGMRPSIINLIRGTVVKRGVAALSVVTVNPVAQALVEFETAVERMQESATAFESGSEAGFRRNTHPCHRLLAKPPFGPRKMNYWPKPETKFSINRSDSNHLP